MAFNHWQMTIVFFIVYNIATVTIADQSWPEEVDIGLIANGFDEFVYNFTVDEALSTLVNASIVPKNFKFNLNFKRGCDDVKSLTGAMQLWNSSNISVIIGPECELGASVVGLMAALKNKPIIGYMTMSNEMANREKYKTFSSVAYTVSYTAQAVRATLLHHNWTNVALIRTHSTNCTVPFSGLPAAFKEYGITITNDILIDLSDSSNVFDGLRTLFNSARIFILCCPYSPRDALPFLQYANQSGMITQDFVYVVPWTTRYSMGNWKPWSDPNITYFDSAIYRALYRNVLVVLTTGTLSQQFKGLQTKIQDRINEKKSANFSITISTDDILTLAPFRDAVYLYGISLNRTITNDLDLYDGLSMYKSALGIQFTGVTDTVILDNNGERATDYYCARLEEGNTGFPHFLTIGKNRNASKNDDLQIIEVTKIINWSWGSTPNYTAPDDKPDCGFQGELCIKGSLSYSTTTLVTALAICAIIGGISIIGVTFYYKKRSFERDLQQLAWKIDLNKLIYTENVTRGSLKSVAASNRSETYHSLQESENDFKSGENGMYKSHNVFIKRWQRHATVTLSRDQLLKLKSMKGMVQENLARFFGFSIDADKAVLCLWSYCVKRSLNDIVFNTDIHLDLTFQISILRDVISGLDFLHNSSIGHHGRLFTTKCLVDGRWIVKLSGFGVHDIISDLIELKQVSKNGSEPTEKLLCTAPELLRSKCINVKAIDIYQFAMIAYQVLYREEPFSDFNLESEEILAMIKSGAIPTIRPILKPIQHCDSRLLTILQNCWLENPSNRPAVAQMKKDIFNITKKFGKNLIDHVMNKLEKYATNLEKIVDERTEQLNEERKRADLLLYQMLPKTVADALKAGRTVNPESFECATVYFSDVVGFSDICSKSSPVEMVKMLNNLYSVFDETILLFDAYKVETIGDSYLIVSGLPVRNGLDHVTNICDMSFKILKSIKDFSIPHLPNQKVHVRIGIHSGSVAAGVIGLAMPKFCLFGDTVNFASRMETTGEAGKIHITEDTKSLLENFPQYIVLERGKMEVKGKGLRTTYWLTEKPK